jgi:hypothetical protein
MDRVGLILITVIKVEQHKTEVISSSILSNTISKSYFKLYC